MVFNPSGRKLNYDKFVIQGTKLESVTSYCYLGIDVSLTGSFRYAKNILSEKAHKAMFPLFYVITQFNLLNKTLSRTHKTYSNV